MATYVLVHGSGDSAFHWHLLEPELHALGHETVSVDLPCEDDSAGLAEYADTVLRAIGDRTGSEDDPDLILVAQSFGAFIAPMVCDRAQVGLIVLIAGMVPESGETGDDWMGNTGYPGPKGESEREIFYNDVPEEVIAEAEKHSRNQSGTPGGEPWPLDEWPDVPTRYLLCQQDHMFPADWMREVVRSRLGIEPDDIESGHCPALSRPRELAERLEDYRVGSGLS